MRSAAAVAVRCTSAGAGQSSQLASTSWIDPSEVEIGINCSKDGTQADEHY